MIREYDTDDMEEPVMCDCGKWVELQDTFLCDKCNDHICPNCASGRLCEICHNSLNEDEE